MYVEFLVCSTLKSDWLQAKVVFVKKSLGFYPGHIVFLFQTIV